MRRRLPSMSVRSRRLLHLLEHLVEAEARRLLSRRELLEALQELRDTGLRRHEQVDTPEHPVPVCVRGFYRALVRIHPQIEDIRRTQHDEWFQPDLERFF